MNTTVPGFSSFSPTQTSKMSDPAATLRPSSVPERPDGHDPQFTIMVVLGLALLLAGVAAFLAARRGSAREDGGSEVGCGPGSGLARGGGALSSEPQLKVWKRLGSYRRSYNISFRRPAQRRPRDCEPAQGPARSPAAQTLQTEGSAEPQLTAPCLFDYVTEI